MFCLHFFRHFTILLSPPKQCFVHISQSTKTRFCFHIFSAHQNNTLFTFLTAHQNNVFFLNLPQLATTHNTQNLQKPAKSQKKNCTIWLIFLCVMPSFTVHNTCCTSLWHHELSWILKDSLCCLFFPLCHFCGACLVFLFIYLYYVSFLFLHFFQLSAQREPKKSSTNLKIKRASLLSRGSVTSFGSQFGCIICYYGWDNDDYWSVFIWSCKNVWIPSLLCNQSVCHRYLKAF